MADFRVNGGGAGVPGAGSTVTFDPFFKAWSQWLANGTGPARTIPGASLPWLTKPGISTGEEVKPLPEGAMANDPLLSALSKMQEANPLRNIVPLDWLEITRALQTLWMREVSNPVRAMQVATDYNRRLFETTMNVWSDVAARFWGMRQEKGKEEGTSDPRFSSEVWDSNPYYKMFKDTYLLASEYLMKEAEENNGRGDPEKQRHLEFHLRQFVEAMSPVNFLFTNPDALERAFERREAFGGPGAANDRRWRGARVHEQSQGRPSRGVHSLPPTLLTPSPPERRQPHASDKAFQGTAAGADSPGRVESDPCIRMYTH